jgi:hypothetical protein
VTDFTTIRPGIGLGELRFGATRDEIRALAGEPTDVMPSEAEAGSEVWIYESAAAALHFAGDASFRFVSCETFSVRAALNGETFVGDDREDAEAALERAGVTGVEWLSDPEEGAGQLVAPAQGLALYFADGVVESIGWGVLFDDDENVLWPA